MHICAGVGFVGLLFWHCNNQLTSWHYLYATAAVWASGLLYRLLFRSSFLRAFAGERAHFTPLTDHGVMITIPTTLRWNPGQHVFIRIPQINPFDNHPFTVASCVERPIGEHNDLVLVFKPQRGFTKKVAAIARKDPDNSYRVFLDGPYGGLQRKLEAFETVLMIAGGSGITPCVAHLQELARKIRNKKAITRDVRIIWTVKHFGEPSSVCPEGYYVFVHETLIGNRIPRVVQRRHLGRGPHDAAQHAVGAVLRNAGDARTTARTPRLGHARLAHLAHVPSRHVAHVAPTRRLPALHPGRTNLRA